MPDLDLEQILKAIYGRTQQQRRNPAASAATSQGQLDELPIAIIALRPTQKVSKPLWANWILTDEVIDTFQNTGNSDINLSTHTSDSGDQWTAEQGLLHISTGDWVERP